MSNTPLPPIVERADEHYHGEGLADVVHAHAAAVSAADNADIQWLYLREAEKVAAKDAEIAGLRSALAAAIRQNEHDMLMTGEELRAARATLGDMTPTPPPSTSPQS